MIDAAILDQLTAYAALPRGGRSGRTWTVDELTDLLDPSITVMALMARLSVKRAVVTYELMRLRQAGVPVPDRPSGWIRAPRTIAMEADLRTGMTDAEAARRYGVSPVRVQQVRVRAGLPTTRRLWTEGDREVLIAHQDRPAHAVAALVGRTVRAVDAERSRLIARGRIEAKIARPQKRAE